jgi:hypothetical protein
MQVLRLITLNHQLTHQDQVAVQDRLDRLDAQYHELHAVLRPALFLGGPDAVGAASVRRAAELQMAAVDEPGILLGAERISEQRIGPALASLGLARPRSIEPVEVRTVAPGDQFR